MMTEDDWERCKYEEHNNTYTYDNEEYEVTDEISAHAVVLCTQRCYGYSAATYESPAEYDYDDWEVELESLDFYNENGDVKVPDEVYERVKKEVVARALEEAH